MTNRIAACTALVLAVSAAAGATTPAQLDALLASSPTILRSAPMKGDTSPHPQNARYVRVTGANAAGWVDPSEVTDGYLASGQRVMAVPIESGGTGGVFTALLFTQVAGAPRFVGTIPSGGHLSVSVNAGHLLIQMPVYGANDPNCCPSALHFERATLRGTRLVSEEQWDVKLARRP